MPTDLLRRDLSGALVTTQREILALIKSLQVARGMGLLLVTHDLRIAFSMCDRVNVMYAGVMVEVASARDIDAAPLHPYTQGLLQAEPPGTRRVTELVAIPGSVPAADEVADMCPFAPRCAWSGSECRETRPPLRRYESGRGTRCIRIDEISSSMTKQRESAGADTVQPSSRAQAEDALVVVSDARKTFASGKREVVALDTVSLQVDEGEGVGLVGESGSGKTTVGRSVVGLETLTSGRIEIAGIDASDWSRVTRREQKRLQNTVQMVFQDPYSSLNPMRTIGSTLAEAITAHEPRARNLRGKVEELLSSVGLETEYAQRKPVALSGGQHQRAAIARALAVRPKVLVCDEPVAALDVSVQAQILNLFSSLRDEHEIGYLFITHDLSIVRQVVERVYVMHRGRIVESGDVDEVLSSPRHAYTAKLIESIPEGSSSWLDADDPGTTA